MKEDSGISVHFTLYAFFRIHTPILIYRGIFYAPKKGESIMKTVNTQKMVRASLLCAISVALAYFIHFPLIPAFPFLEYDPADISILIIGLSYGSGWGLMATVVVSLVQGLFTSSFSLGGFIGIIMHIVSTGAFVTAVSHTYKKTSKFIPSLAIGVITMVIVMIPVNLVFTGIFMKTGVIEVAKMLIPAIIPFNFMKAGINAVISGIIFKHIKKYAIID